MTTTRISQMYQAPNRNFIARHFCASMSSTAQKIAGVAAVGLFVGGGALITAASYGAVTVAGIAAIGFAGLTVSSLGLYIAGAVLMGLSIYLCARLIFAPDTKYVDFLQSLENKLNNVQKTFSNASSCMNTLGRFTNEKAKKLYSPIVKEAQPSECEKAKKDFLDFLRVFLPNFVQHDSLKRVLKKVIVHVRTNPHPTNPFYEDLNNKLTKLADQIPELYNDACSIPKPNVRKLNFDWDSTLPIWGSHDPNNRQVHEVP